MFKIIKLTTDGEVSYLSDLNVLVYGFEFTVGHNSETMTAGAKRFDFKGIDGPEKFIELIEQILKEVSGDKDATAEWEDVD